jgi:hypothetical protein
MAEAWSLEATGPITTVTNGSLMLTAAGGGGAGCAGGDG